MPASFLEELGRIDKKGSITMPSDRPILIASDHAGILLKSELQKLLTEWTWIDLGPSNGIKVDYPDYAQLLAQNILDGKAQEGILICGTGVGMSIAANKIQGIRAALVDNPVLARLSREHNHANVLCLGSRLLAPEYAAEIIQVWLSTPFSQDSRHLQRLDKLRRLENSFQKKDLSS